MRTLRRVFQWTPGWLFLVAVIGCGRANRAAIDGRVTLDGKAVDGGTISFVPIGSAPGPAAGGKIGGGNYSIPATKGLRPGIYRVEIHWVHKTGRMRPALPPAPAGEEFAELIPTHYNSESELKAEIKPGENHFDFELKSK